MANTDVFSDKEVLAKTIYGENRGGGEAGMQSVANVIMNRAANPCWWGNDVRSVCLKYMQFDCWMPTDPNYKTILDVTIDDPIYAIALDIAEKALAGTLEDLTGGATYYFAKTMPKWPKWAEGKTPSADIRGQLFFNDVA